MTELKSFFIAVRDLVCLLCGSALLPTSRQRRQYVIYSFNSNRSFVLHIDYDDVIFVTLELGGKL